MPTQFSFKPFSFYLFFLIAFLFILGSLSVAVSAQDSSAAVSDELKIEQDRDQAILAAVDGFSKTGKGELKIRKIELKDSGEPSSGWSWSKLAFWKEESNEGARQPVKREIASVVSLPRNDSGKSVIASKTSNATTAKDAVIASKTSNATTAKDAVIASPEGAKQSGKREIASVVSLPRNDSSQETKHEAKTSKRVKSNDFFSKPEESSNFNEVKKKRTKRLRQFPELDPDSVKEAITETKIQLKKEFINMGEHNLESAIQRAIQVHLPAQIAHERILLSERRIMKAFRDFFSSADLTASHKDGTIASGPYKHNDWRVNLRQPLFKGGILWNTYQLEMANREVARNELDQTVNEIVAETSQAYLEYERAWNVMKDKEKLFEQVTKLKNLSDQKVKAALVSEIEKLNMDSIYGQTEYDMQTSKQDLELAKLELQKVLELDINDPIDIKSMITIDNVSFSEVSDVLAAPKPVSEIKAPGASLMVEGKDLEHFIDMAYVYRADLQVEASKLRAARLGHKISVGKHLPEADLIMEFGKLGEAFEGTDLRFQGDLETTEPKLKTEWRIGAELSWKLGGNTLGYTFDHDQRAPSVSQFQGGQGPISDTSSVSFSILDNLNSLAELKETKIAALEQVVQLENAERDAIREIKEAYFNYNKATIQAGAADKKMKYRERLKVLAEHRHSNNEIQVSEYLQAEIDLYEERAALHKALADVYLAKVNLNRAIGIRDYLKIEGHAFENRA